MTMSAQTSQHDDILQKTAARLIYVLGVDYAINECRNNNWSAVLRFVLAYRTFLDQQPRPFGFARRRPPVWLDTFRHTMSPTVSEPAIAA